MRRDYMTINKAITDSVVTLSLEGRLNTITSPELEATLQEVLPGTTSLVLDLKDLVYVSSAGLRVLLKAAKTMNKQGKMVLTGVCDAVMEVFEVTGFSDLLNFE